MEGDGVCRSEESFILEHLTHQEPEPWCNSVPYSP